MEKIGNMQIVDNKENKFFCFPMISIPCTGTVDQWYFSCNYFYSVTEIWQCAYEVADFGECHRCASDS